MKFNKYFIANQKGEWNRFYVDYKGLKKIIKSDTPDNFPMLLDKEIQKVNMFYKFTVSHAPLHPDLSNYILYNYMALYKITKKYDKKLSQSVYNVSLQKHHFLETITSQSFYKHYIGLPRPHSDTTLVIFDKDGTLIDHDSIFKQWLLEFTSNLTKYYPQISLTSIYSVLGYNTSTETFESMSVVPRGTNTDVKNVIQKYFCQNLMYTSQQCHEILQKCLTDVILNTTNVKPLGDLHRIFNTLRLRDIKIAVCTSDDRRATMESFKILNIERYLSQIVCGDDPISNKPLPDPIWHVCQKLKVKPEQTVMIGDTISDIHAGINARCGRVIGVLSGGYNNTNLNDADRVVQSINDIDYSNL